MTQTTSVSGNAYKALASKMREWSGWPKARLTLGEPESTSPYALTDMVDQHFTINTDALVRNPNRVLNNLTPFRLRQEAVLTGAMLHEAAHARHTKWVPIEAVREHEKNGGPAPVLRHSPRNKQKTGDEVSKPVLSLARVLDEPRVEAQILRDIAAGKVNAPNLGWTMRATTAAILPLTEVSDDPNQAVMDVVTSWVLRAGRWHAADQATGSRTSRPAWVQAFDDLLTDVIADHLGEDPMTSEFGAAGDIEIRLKQALHAPDSGTVLFDLARDIMEALFPDTDPDDMPSASSGCGTAGDEQGDEQGEGGTGAQPGAGKPGEAGSGSEGEGEGEGEGDLDDAPAINVSAVAKQLNEAEAESNKAASTGTDQPSAPGSGGTGFSGETNTPNQRGWREPTARERETARAAERFLRDLINPDETTTTSLSESPSTQVDPAAMSAWKAGGQVRAPMFFRRTRRNVEPTPPVQIAVLVDVSGSMEVFQTPSAVLSWALSSAALDLRNFAGRGAQVASTLIHWGDGEPEVISAVGSTMPGIRTVACRQGTTIMHKALAEVENQMPGFFDITETPSNRLLVQFTDWSMDVSRVKPMLERASAAGVDMLTVAPNGRWSHDRYYHAVRDARGPGRNEVYTYNPKEPDGVWTHAAQMLASR